MQLPPFRHERKKPPKRCPQLHRSGLGEHAFTIFDSDTSNERSSVNVYSYFKTGANTASLVNLSVLPPYEWNADDLGGVGLSFTSANAFTIIVC